ncbi:MAG: hypothetical protein AB7F82_06710 [Alphaproteobacteria bacterium]
MAQQVARAKPEGSHHDSPPQEKQDGGGAGYFTGFLQEYRPPERSQNYDILNSRYQIELGKPLPELNTRQATAYQVTDLLEPQHTVYALVCAIASSPRHDTIGTLMDNPHPNILHPLDAGVVRLSQNDESRFVIIHERPKGESLSAFLARVGPLGEEFITRVIIRPMAMAIRHMEECQLAHGRINPDNIFIKDTLVIGECVSEPCGYSQPFMFEPLERIQSHHAGKGSLNAQDYYALAVVVVHALFGAKHLSAYTRDTMIDTVLREGTYYTLIRGRSHPEAYDDFLRGMLHDIQSDRWNWKQLKPWLNGKRFNVLPPPSPTANIRPFEHNRKQVYTRRELAEDYFRDWVSIPSALRDSQFLHWMGVSLRNKPLAENIERIIESMSQLTVKEDVQFNELLMRIIILLDHEGPIRMYPLSFYPDSLPCLYLEYYRGDKTKELNLLLRFLEQNMVMFWVNLQKQGDTDELEQNIKKPLQAILERLDKMRVCMRNTGPGFGAERVLYELDPDLPCMSPLVIGKHVLTLEDLLTELDRLAPGMANKNNAIDNHIFAFIASRLGIQHAIRLRELENIPALANSRECIALRLISMAQYRCGNIKLYGLSHWMALQLLPIFSNVKSSTIRKLIQRKLKESASSGYVQVMAKEMLDSAFIDQDYRSFKHALFMYQDNIRRMESLQKSAHLEKRSNHLGLQIAKFMAYGIFLLTLFSVTKGGGI